MLYHKLNIILKFQLLSARVYPLKSILFSTVLLPFWFHAPIGISWMIVSMHAILGLNAIGSFTPLSFQASLTSEIRKMLLNTLFKVRE